MLLPLSLLGALAATASVVTILKIALHRPRLASCRRWGLAPEQSMIRSAEITSAAEAGRKPVRRCPPRLSGRPSRLMWRGPRIRKSTPTMTSVIVGGDHRWAFLLPGTAVAVIIFERCGVTIERVSGQPLGTSESRRPFDVDLREGS